MVEINKVATEEAKPDSGIEKYLDGLMPDPETFGDQYSAEEIQADINQIEAFHKQDNYVPVENRYRSKLLENTFVRSIEIDDWFGEFDCYGEDPDFLAITTIPTCEIDDMFNHIDLISVIGNECTGGKVMPFAVDLTYNTDEEKMTKKFSWRHAYGKKVSISQDIAGDEVSEFGTSHYDEKGAHWRKSLPMGSRRGIKMPGFTSAKYFEDTNHGVWEQTIPKGRINIMPRFVVGYSSSLAEKLADLPTMEDVTKYEEPGFEKEKQEHEQKLKEYRYAVMCAKWCTINECLSQAEDIRDMLGRLTEDDVRYINGNEVLEAKEQAEAMCKYFHNALETARKRAKESPDEEFARMYAQEDEVCKSIISHSHDTYLKPPEIITPQLSRNNNSFVA